MVSKCYCWGSSCRIQLLLWGCDMYTDALYTCRWLHGRTVLGPDHRQVLQSRLFPRVRRVAHDSLHGATGVEWPSTSACWQCHKLLRSAGPTVAQSWVEVADSERRRSVVVGHGRLSDHLQEYQRHWFVLTSWTCSYCQPFFMYRYSSVAVEHDSLLSNTRHFANHAQSSV